MTPPLQRGHSHGFTTDVVVELGYATREDVTRAIEAARAAGRTPESLLLSEETINGDQLSRAIAERYGLDHVDLTSYHVDFGAAGLFPVTMARRYMAVPVGYINQQTLLVAAADPANVLAADDIQIATGLDCRIAVAAEEDVEALLSRLGTLQNAAADAILEEDDREQDSNAVDQTLAGVSEMQVSAEDAPVIKLVYSLLAQAVGEGASDVHLEPEEDELRIRFRIDGVLKEAAHVPKRMISAVISRLKIMSELDIAEKRVPQDGRVGVCRRGPPGRPARHHPADPARRGGDDPHPRRGQLAAHARRSRHGRISARPFRGLLSDAPTAPFWSPARPAPASRRRSTRR